MKMRITRKNLRPLANVEPYSTPAYQWAALSDNPQFLIEIRPEFASKRALFYGQIKHDGETNTSLTVYFNTGNGYSNDHAVCITPNQKGMLSCIVDLPAKLVALRIDPIACTGRFSLKLSVYATDQRNAENLSVGFDTLRILQAFYQIGYSLKAAAENLVASFLQDPSISLMPEIYQSREGGSNRRRFLKRWLARRKMSPSRHADNRKISRTWRDSQKISVLMYTDTAQVTKLCKSIDSVRAQDYENWEVCIVTKFPLEPSDLDRLKAYERDDKRVKIYYSQKVVGAAAALNRSLGTAAGEYVTTLNCGDLLAPHALYRLAECIQSTHPDMIYTDEALVEEASGNPVDFVFRPAFSLELLRSTPYIHHIIAFRSGLLREVGGYNENLVEALHYDLVLRAAEHAKVVTHIPEILYFQTVTHEFGRQNMKVEQIDASKAVLAAHLERCNLPVKIEGGANSNVFNIEYLFTRELRVAIVIPTKNHGELVRVCVESIERTVEKVVYDIIVIDHESDDPATLDYFLELENKHTVLRYKGLFNFSTINNWAIRQLEPQYTHYLLCNNDIEAITPGWLEKMLELGQQEDVGIVGAKLYFAGGQTIQHAGVCIGLLSTVEHFGKFIPRKLPNTEHTSPGYLGSLITNREVSAVTGACLLIRRDVFDEIEGMDELFAVGYGDVDLCLRARVAGYRVLFCPHAELIHHESYTRGKTFSGDPHPEDTEIFVKRWHSYIAEGDPFYNPNLTLTSPRWEVAFRNERRSLAPRTIVNKRS